MAFPIQQWLHGQSSFDVTAAELPNAADDSAGEQSWNAIVREHEEEEEDDATTLSTAGSEDHHVVAVSRPADGVQQQPRAVWRTTHHQLQPEPQPQSQPHSLWQRGVAAGWLCPEAGRYSGSGGGSSGSSGTSARVRLREATVGSAVSAVAAATVTSSLGTSPAGDNREREDACEAQAQLDARERELAWREKLQRSARVGDDVYGGLVVACRVVRGDVSVNAVVGSALSRGLAGCGGWMMMCCNCAQARVAQDRQLAEQKLAEVQRYVRAREGANGLRACHVKLQYDSQAPAPKNPSRRYFCALHVFVAGAKRLWR